MKAMWEWLDQKAQLDYRACQEYQADADFPAKRETKENAAEKDSRVQ